MFSVALIRVRGERVASTEGEDQNNTEDDHLSVSNSSSDEGEGEAPTDVVIRTTAVEDSLRPGTRHYAEFRQNIGGSHRS